MVHEVINKHSGTAHLFCAFQSYSSIEVAIMSPPLNIIFIERDDYIPYATYNYCVVWLAVVVLVLSDRFFWPFDVKMSVR